MAAFHHYHLVTAALYVFACIAIITTLPTARLARDADKDKQSDKISKNHGLENLIKDEDKEDSHYDLFEGDIELTEFQKIANGMMRSSLDNIHTNSKRQVHSIESSHKIWPGGIIPYMFHSTLATPDRDRFRAAIRQIMNSTCINFVDARSTDTDYLMLNTDQNCMSHVGRVGGIQSVYFGPLCNSIGNIVHELGHAIGLWHEHSRPDRDTYIRVVYDNIKNDSRLYFNRTTPVLFESVPDVGYDIESIMHYGSYAFSREHHGGVDQETIQIKYESGLKELECLNRLAMGQRTQLSYKDILRINTLYNCSSAAITKPVCILPTPTPTTPLPTLTTERTFPTPSSTLPILTPSPLSRRLKSGNQIALRAGNSTYAYGLRCAPTPGCQPILCKGLFNICEGSLTSANNRFRIIRSNSSSGSAIKSGDTVMFRSVQSPRYWLDCTSFRKCTISLCSSDHTQGGTLNSSYVSTCDYHKFRVFGLKKSSKRISNEKFINTNHRIQITNSNDNSTLSCNDDRDCLMVNNSVCRTGPVPVPIPGRGCPESFFVSKLFE